MADRVASHYSKNLELADAIAQKLRSVGKDLNKLTTADLVAVDEFHIRGRKATLELGGRMKLSARSHVLDIGSGLGGPARTLAETYGCRVTGVDLTQAFCDAATAMSNWVGLGSRVSFKQGDATNLPFENQTFDAAMTIHVAMNIAAKMLDVQNSTEESQSFFEKMTAQMAKTGTSPVIWQLFLGDDFPAMARNQVRNVTERRIRTVSYFCVA